MPNPSVGTACPAFWAFWADSAKSRPSRLPFPELGTVLREYDAQHVGEPVDNAGADSRYDSESHTEEPLTYGHTPAPESVLDALPDHTVGQFRAGGGHGLARHRQVEHFREREQPEDHRDDGQTSVEVEEVEREPWLG